MPQLFLSRRVGERILLRYHDVEMWVQVVEFSPSCVRLAIVAPPEVTILRDEVLLAQQEAKREEAKP